MSELFETLIASIECRDIDELAEVARHWTEEYIQLGAGSLKTLLDIFQLGDIQFGLQQWNLSVRVRGNSPAKTISIGIPITSQGQAIWYGRTIAQDQIMFAHPSEEHYLTGLGQTKLWIISVNQDILLREAEAIGLPEIESFIMGKCHFIYPDPLKLAAVQHYLKNLWQLVKAFPQQAIQPSMQSLIRRDFIPLFLNLIVSDNRQQSRVPISKRLALVKRAEEFIEDHLHQPLTLRDLYEHLQVSERTLRYSFEDCLGISPMAYVKIQRLHGVRRELKASDPTEGKVSQIATRWGFWHMGQFSQDYKKLFGECPSQTIGSSRGSAPVPARENSKGSVKSACPRE